MGDSDSDTDPDISTILQYLIRRWRAFQLRIRPSGQVRIITADSGHLYRDDSDEEFCPISVPPQTDSHPDTSLLDENELSQHIKLKLSHTKKPSLPRLLMQRETGIGRQQAGFSLGEQCQIGLRFLPNTSTSKENYCSKVFCGTFAKDGDLLITASQDYNIRIYDTRGLTYIMLKKLKARDVGWSILDTAVSPDGRNFVYCSWSESIHVCNIFGETESHHALPLYPDDRRFCIFSLKYSQDGKEILGGANDECLYIYDMEHNQRTLKIRSHDNDVNSVAFADLTSQILFSCGDDGLCKIWDRRVLSEEQPKPVGILAGHLDGITYVDSKGDGRYLITNSKDQTIKLWDIRALSPPIGAEATKKAVTSHNWDYRWQRVPRRLNCLRKKIAGDTSLMTYRGHSVLQTLIRCRFSPIHTTAQSFIYTGCAVGKVVVYDLLTGKIMATLNGHRACVRDVDWHPYRPEIVSTSWDGSIQKWNYINYQDENEEDGQPLSSSSPRDSPKEVPC